MSIKDKITPGPWKLINIDSDDYFPSVVLKGEASMETSDRIPIAYHSTKEENRATAKAISKVPEMLEILERLGNADAFDPDAMATLQQNANKLLKQLNNE